MEKSKKEIAKSMIKDKMDIEVVSKYTSLSLEELSQLDM